jgi:anhydro-N-acetylmuramic acid kinase
MFNQQYLWSLGIMSGTSLDAIDLAMLKTDGNSIIEHGDAHSVPIPSDLQNELRNLMQQTAAHNITSDFLQMEQRYSELVAEAVLEFIKKHEIQPDIIGLHGQTIIHRPLEGITWQLGNANIIAQRTNIGVISDFRRRDMAAGGQGAPLVPLYHVALCEKLPKPIAIVNIGGVANVTYIGEDSELIAFDTGTGNALINDWVQAHTGEPFDDEGRYAATGNPDLSIVQNALSHLYFAAKPPKSLDRNDFNSNMVEGLNLHDGAATLMQFTVSAIAASQKHFPSCPKQWVICGGGAHNKAMMAALANQLPSPVIPATNLGWRSDALEAEAFAYLAVRVLIGLPLSLPSTTGVAYPITGGALHQSEI